MRTPDIVVEVCGGLRLSVAGKQTSLEQRNWEQVLALAACNNGIVTKEEVCQAVWQESFENAKTKLKTELTGLRRELLKFVGEEQNKELGKQFVPEESLRVVLNPDYIRCEVGEFLEPLEAAGQDIPNQKKLALYETAIKAYDELFFSRGALLNGYPWSWIAPKRPELHERYTSAKAKRDALKDSVAIPQEPPKYRLVKVPKGTPYFTGRRDVLDEIHQSLRSGTTTALTQALRGLGGIGKTQTAIAYANEAAQREDYRYILWTAADDMNALLSGFAALSVELGQATAQETDQNAVIEKFQKWMMQDTNGEWLLILDNADYPELLRHVLPSAIKGRLLLTSRSTNFDAMGNLAPPYPVALETFTPDEAETFLLARTERTETITDDERRTACDLAEELGYFPLALEQAAAYIKAEGIRFRTYLKDYRALEITQIEKSPPLMGDYVERDTQEYRTVRKTWEINFRAAAGELPATEELLNLCAFFAPDAIPAELVIAGCRTFESGLQAHFADCDSEADFEERYDTLLKPLTKFSLVNKDISNLTFSLHRMVQAVVRSRMTADEYTLWLQRAIAACLRVFPDSDDHRTWGRCERVRLHGTACGQWAAKSGLQTEQAALLLNNLGYYVKQRGQYQEAEPLYKDALTMRRKALPEGHPDIAQSLNNLAALYGSQGRYDEAEPLLKDALAIDRVALPQGHPDIAQSLNNLAGLYESQGRYDEAEPLYIEALAIDRAALPASHPDIATDLNNLALLYRSQGHYDEAEPLYKDALTMRRKALPEGHPDIATSLNNLAALYRSQGRYDEAEPLYKDALAIDRVALPQGHPDIAIDLNNLADLYRSQGRYDEAEPLYKDALAIWRRALPEGHPSIAQSLNNLAALYKIQGRYDEAEPLYREAVAIMERSLGANHPNTVTVAGNYAVFLLEQERSEEAFALIQRFPKLLEQVMALMAAGQVAEKEADAES